MFFHLLLISSFALLASANNYDNKYDSYSNYTTHKNILINGASSRIAREFVLQVLKQYPENVIAVCTNEKSCSIYDDLVNKYPNLHILTLDILDFDFFINFERQVRDIVGYKGLDLIVHAAYEFKEDRRDSLVPSEMVRLYEVNAVSPLILTTRLLPLLRAAEKNYKYVQVVYLTTDLSSITLTNGLRYAFRMSETALNQGVRTLAADLKNENMEFILFDMGNVKTDMIENVPTVTIEQSVKGMLKQLYRPKSVRYGRLTKFDGTLLPF